MLNADGTLNDLAGPELAGLDRFAGRKKAAELLKASGALVAEEAYANNVGYSERADVPIEPRLTWQWWLRYPRVEEAKAAVRDGHGGAKYGDREEYMPAWTSSGRNFLPCSR